MTHNNSSSHSCAARRANLVCGVMMAVIVLYLFGLFVKSGAVYGSNPEVDALRTETMEALQRAIIREGIIVDRDGGNITMYVNEDQGMKSVYPEAYGFLVGYNDSRFGRYGIRGRLDKYLYGMADADNVGCTVYLTTSNVLQLICYEAIGETAGSAIVLENATGKILALASRGVIPFDPDRLVENMPHYNAHEGFFLPNGWSEKDPPGSVMKIVTAACALENGFTDADLLYEDTGVLMVPGGGEIHNYGDHVYGRIGLERAFASSVNTYFANLALKLGANNLDDIMKGFMLGETVELDFTILTSSRDMGTRSPFYVAQTGFGQGRIQVTPLHLAMITQSIANDGVMLKPYVIGDIRQGTRSVGTKGKPEVLSKPVRKDTAKSIQAIMKEAAKVYGLDGDNTVGIKTGTAELANGLNHVYLCAFTEEYTVVLSRNESAGVSGQLVEGVKGILEVINNL